MTTRLARIVLLILVLAFLVNVARGTANQWLHAKFLGAA